MSFQSNNTSHLTRAELWSTELKAILEDELFYTRYIRWLSDFPDGDLLHIPSIGEMLADDYQEGQAVKYTAMDTGDFTFQITEYKQSGTYITNKAKQDLYYSNELISQFVPKQARALAVAMETDALRVGPEGQVASDPNVINGLAHRFIGTGNGGGTISVEDFARARLALQKANVPMTNLVAIVDPSVEFTFNTLTNFTNLSFNKSWEGIVREGIGTGMQFKVNVYGFDVYVSNYLKSGMTDTIYGETAVSGVANLFFSAEQGILPIVGAVRQAPKVDSEYNKDEQRDEYVTTCRYGMKLFRPENLVTVITNNTVATPTYS